MERANLQQSDSLKRKIANIDFSYSDPTPNFDRTQVKGLIAQLFSLPEQNFKSATALEICAGGRLYNVPPFRILFNSRSSSKMKLSLHNFSKRGNFENA